MVLDDASPTSFGDEAPTSSADTDLDSGDAWSSLRRNGPGNIRHTTTLPSFINLRDFPRPAPIPFLAQRRGWNDERVIHIVCSNAASLSALAQRQLTRPEWESITYHIARMNAISSYGFPTGLGIAWYRCYATRESFRFPFYKPKLVPEGKFNPDQFADILKGPLARYQWHIFRALAYGTLGGFLGAAFFTSFATMSAAVHQATDARMQELTGLVKEEAKRQRARFNERRGPRTVPLRDSDKERMDQENEEDRSPTLQELATEASERRDAEARNSPKSVEYGAGAGELYSNTSFDDASPTASSEAPPQPQAETNAWQRIRQERSRGQPQPRQAASYPRPGQQPQGNAWMERRRESAAQTPSGGTREDSFSFSSNEEERQLAKEEAQKEFDARVERERQGKDFVDDASPTASRWR